MRHGGQILVDHLRAYGVKRVFSVPGESFLAALDGLYHSGIENVVCRHEGAAAMMAEATGKLTGQPGICFVTRGPGATNAAAGVHVAHQDSTPMILFVGQIARGHRDRDAFQEVDYRAMFGGLAKWVAEVEDLERLPEYLSRAFHLASAGRPGPVVLALPEDMLSGRAEVADLPPPAARLTGIAADSLQAVEALLRAAKRPLVVAGGSLWSAQAGRDLAQLAESWDLPVAVSFRRQGHFDNRHPQYIGDLGVGMNPALGARLQEADLLLVLGARLSDSMTGSYRLLDPARPLAAQGKRLVHIYPQADELGRVYRPDLGLAVSPVDFLAAWAATGAAPEHPPAWAGWRKAGRADYARWQTPRATPGAVQLEEVIAHLSATLPPEAIVTNGAGNYAAFLHRYFRYKDYGTQLAPTSGSMGYGLPAAIAAALAHPQRPVICLAGDGCLQMTLNELSTAMQYRAKPVIVVANNGQYGTIRMHQERQYPQRVSGTALVNPDFAALARAYGGFGVVVRQSADFPQALRAALAADCLAVIELQLDPEALSAGASLAEIRARATPDKA